MRSRTTTRFLVAYGVVASISATVFVTPSVAQNDTLRLGVPSLPPTRGNPLQGLGTPTSYVWSALFDAMTRIDDNGNVAAEAAVSWKSVDKDTWHFALRPAVKFHNGEMLTAEGVAQSIAFLLTDEGKATLSGRDLSQKIISARAVDALTVEIKSSFPNPEMPREVMKLYLTAPKAWAELGVQGFSSNPSGTGSYKLDNWSPEAVRMVSFDESWRRPKLSKFNVIDLGESAARLQALLSNQIDAAIGLSLDALPQIEAAKFSADVYPAPYILAWPFISSEESGRKTPFSDKRVRQAANYAIDKESIVTNLYKGHGFPAGQGATRFTFGYNPQVKAYPYDPERARKLLAEAGYPNGFKMAAEVLPGNFPADSEIYQKAAQDLAKVGIQVEVRGLTFADYLKKIIPPQGGTTLGFPDDVMAFQLDFPLQTGQTAASLVQRNWSCRRKVNFYCDQAELKMLEDAETEFDTELRRQKLQKLMASFHDNAPGLFMIEIVDIVARSPKVQNLKMTHRILNYHEVTKSN